MDPDSASPAPPEHNGSLPSPNIHWACSIPLYHPRLFPTHRDVDFLLAERPPRHAVPANYLGANSLPLGTSWMMCARSQGILISMLAPRRVHKIRLDTAPRSFLSSFYHSCLPSWSNSSKLVCSQSDTMARFPSQQQSRPVHATTFMNQPAPSP